MSKFQTIHGNKFGSFPMRNIKQILEQHKQEEDREKHHKCEPLCVEQYSNPFTRANSSSNCASAKQPPASKEANVEEDIKKTDILLSEESILLIDSTTTTKLNNEHHIELPVVYNDNETQTEVKDVVVETEIKNIRMEFKRKQSLKDVVKLSYKHFLQKDPQYM